LDSRTISTTFSITFSTSTCPRQLRNLPSDPAAFQRQLLQRDALVVLLVLTWILVRGISESATANNVMVGIKIAAILIFVIGAAHAVNTANWHPFLPNGIPGMLTGSAIVFFTYIGFDSVSTAAKNAAIPARYADRHHHHPDRLRGPLYCGCAGAHRHRALVHTQHRRPVADALKHLGMNKIRGWVTVGALVAWFHRCWSSSTGRRASGSRCRAMACCPGYFHAFIRSLKRRISARDRGPGRWHPGRHLDIDTFADLSNIGTLFAFIVVSAGVLVLRKTQPERPVVSAYRGVR